MEITKREYFAAKALQGLCAGRTEYENPMVNTRDAIDLADSLIKHLKEKEEPHFTELSKEDQANRMDENLKEMKCWFGGWDELRKRIDELEQGDFEQAFENKYSY